MTRKLLTDILREGDRDSLASAWNETEAADEYGPLPAGTYTCHLIGADLFNSQSNGTPGVKLAFKVIEGEHKNRRVWSDCWLTAAALPQTKRDLLKLGIDRLELLERPLPQFIRAAVRVALRKDDDGNTFNRVRGFDVTGIDEPERDDFAPTDNADGSAGGEHERF